MSPDFALPLLADFDPEMAIPLLAVLLIFGLPIIAILLKHQQKMATLFHENNNRGQNTELSQVRDEMRELKALVHQQSIALDNLLSQQASLNAPKPDRIEQRIGG